MGKFMSELIWPITILIMFFGSLWYLVKRSHFSESLATISKRLESHRQESIRDIEALKLYNKELEHKLSELTSEMNHFKIKQGFNRV